MGIDFIMVSDHEFPKGEEGRVWTQHFSNLLGFDHRTTPKHFWIQLLLWRNPFAKHGAPGPMFFNENLCKVGDSSGGLTVQTPISEVVAVTSVLCCPSRGCPET